ALAWRASAAADASKYKRKRGADGELEAEMSLYLRNYSESTGYYDAAKLKAPFVGVYKSVDGVWPRPSSCHGCTRATDRQTRSGTLACSTCPRVFCEICCSKNGILFDGHLFFAAQHVRLEKVFRYNLEQRDWSCPHCQSPIECREGACHDKHGNRSNNSSGQANNGAWRRPPLLQHGRPLLAAAASNAA
ncbi:MAG: hypothetical protein RL128_688, partial [Pseudomonadota bacterium]